MFGPWNNFEQLAEVTLKVSANYNLGPCGILAINQMDLKQNKQTNQQPDPCNLPQPIH